MGDAESDAASSEVNELGGVTALTDELGRTSSGGASSLSNFMIS
jgi:hypothetical protein